MIFFFKGEERNLNQDLTEDAVVFDPRQLKLVHCLGIVTNFCCCQGFSVSKAQETKRKPVLHMPNGGSDLWH